MNGAIPLYIASKLQHAERWKKLREDWIKSKIDLIARWPYQAQYEDDATDHDFRVFWAVDEEDVKHSEVVIIYGEKGEVLKGALIEAGMAIAYGKTVIIVGDSESFGTWKHHFQVLHAGSLEHAKRFIINRYHLCR